MSSSVTQFRKGNPVRPKGATGKIQTEVKEMIRQALDEAGGIEYLVRQADANPVAFMALLGKLVTREVRADVQGALLEVRWPLPRTPFDVDG